MAFLGLHIISDSQYKAMKAAYDASAKGVISDLSKFGATETTKLVAIVKERFPQLTEAFHQGFLEMQNADLKGFEKMTNVVLDILGRLPQLVPELMNVGNIKDFLFQLGQTLFNDIFTELGDTALELLKKLL